MGIIFKAACQNDIEEIIEMMGIFYKHEQIELNKNKNINVIKELINNSNFGNIILICLDGKTIGYLISTFGYSIEYGGKVVLIDEFYIQQEFRNQGIGTEALKYVEKKLKALGIKTIHLQVKNFNPSAKKLYLKNGFQEIDRVFMMKIL